ncbi:hypothetical protein QW131_17165 [Roseibium salinum]|nr:hypothetical protein [Roseibium salinum]
MEAIRSSGKSGSTGTQTAPTLITASMAAIAPASRLRRTATRSPFCTPAFFKRPGNALAPCEQLPVADGPVAVSDRNCAWSVPGACQDLVMDRFACRAAPAGDTPVIEGPVRFRLCQQRQGGDGNLVVVQSGLEHLPEMAEHALDPVAGEPVAVIVENDQSAARLVLDLHAEVFAAQLADLRHENDLSA